MSALARLHRDPIAQGAHVVALAPWLPPVPCKGKIGTYWHKPRSASVEAGGKLHVTFWCGPGRTYMPGAFLGSLEPPEDLRCGTCVGRALGYEQEDGAIFRPDDHFALPKRCPSTTPGEDGHCLACGGKVNWSRGWNAYGLARHAPDGELAERCQPCPWHGWKDAGVRGDRLVCWSFRCGRDLGPS